MNYEPHQIETVVREVLRRLCAVEQPSTRIESAPGASQATLVWSERLVTWVGLAPRLTAIQHVRFPRGAVVSPLVKDELKRRSISWSFEANCPPVSRQPTHQLHIWGAPDSEIRTRAERLAAQLTTPAFEVVVRLDGEPGDDGCPPNQLDADLESNGLALVLAKLPWRATCELNRHASCRAVTFTTPGMLRRAYEELQPNVLVFDGRRQSAGEILHAVRGYLRYAGQVSQTSNTP